MTRAGVVKLKRLSRKSLQAKPSTAHASLRQPVGQRYAM